MNCNGTHYRAVVIGASAGGLAAVETVLKELKTSFCLPILLVQHISPHTQSYLATHFEDKCALKVKEADDKEPIKRGYFYIAPPNYHLLVEYDGCVALSIDPPVNFSRPSIDVLFESAADYFGKELIGIVLTGANSDGALGLKKIKERGGLTVVQTIETSEAPAMPAAAIQTACVDHILPLEEIGEFLNEICEC
ncbi:chemotaxis protein CheB [Shewanella atlantica]|uniref:protein-glutamate methylesterase n=1 Tax=Shewanella atlantica TaxID=271099 RepID=A0A3S0LFG7_9GAMM|nr:chemotaxis protein CheB [Shewanella atlantica]RTR34241.1 chemotaxis protein CheB [Shewanella atlantica]